MKFRQKNYIHDLIINLASHCHCVSILKVSLVSVICLSDVLCEIHLLFDRLSLFLLAHNDCCLSIGNFFFTCHLLVKVYDLILFSVSALLMMVTLKKLASTGCTLIFTIYQSSTEVFGLFDRICLLSNGNTLFFGETLACLQVNHTVQHDFLLLFYFFGVASTVFSLFYEIAILGYY